jgi:hypothetical protein
LPASSRMSPAESRLSVLPALRLPCTTWMSSVVLVRLTLPPPWDALAGQRGVLPDITVSCCCLRRPRHINTYRSAQPLQPDPNNPQTMSIENFNHSTSKHSDQLFKYSTTPPYLADIIYPRRIE